MKQYNKGRDSAAVQRDFSARVFRAVKKIPRGKVTTYKIVAEAIKNPYAVRAVGNALNKNRSPLIPCHRVVRSDGNIGGYMHGQKNKILILKKEGVLIKNKKVTGRHCFFVIK